MAEKSMRTEKARLRFPLLLFIGLALLAMLISGCGLTPTHTDRASQEWSNGKPLGVATLNNEVALEVDEAGNSFMVWVGLDHKLNFVRLDERAQVAVETRLDLDCNSPLKPQLLLDPLGQLHLAWLDKQGKGMQLFYALLSSDGSVLQGPTIVSSPEQQVARSSMVLDPLGQTVEVFWSDRVPRLPGCYHAALDWSGTVVVPAEVLIPDGIQPAAQADRQGFVHLAWRLEVEGEKPEFHYAVYDPRRRELGADVVTGEPLAQASMFGGAVANAKFDGPWLGLDEDLVYLAWTLEVRQRGELLSLTFYQAFPQPILGQREGASTFEYSPPEVGGDAVHVRGLDPSLTGHPQFLDGQPARQLLACYTLVSGLGNLKTLQIVAIELLAGQIGGQRVVNASRAASVRPKPATDGQGHPYLVWLDTAGFNRYQVIYASTSPQVKETLDRITTYDVVDKMLTAVMSVFSTLFFVPIVLGWTFPSLLGLGIFAWTTGEFEVSNSRTRIALGVAMLLHLGIKVLFFPSLLARFPFSSLLSPPLGLVLGRWILPLFLAGLSVGAVWIYLKRARHRSTLIAYLVYAAVDSVFTLAIYVALPYS